MKHKEHHLTCRTDIGQYRKGDHIEDAAEVEAIQKSEHRHHFTRVAADNEPEPEAPVKTVDAVLDEATAR